MSTSKEINTNTIGKNQDVCPVHVYFGRVHRYTCIAPETLTMQTPHNHIFNWINVWKKVCPEQDLNPFPPITSRVWSPLHHQDNHAGNAAIEQVIHVVRAWASRQTFEKFRKLTFRALALRQSFAKFKLSLQFNRLHSLTWVLSIKTVSYTHLTLPTKLEV